MSTRAGQTDRQTSGFPSILGGRPGVDTSCCADAMAGDPRGQEQRGIGCCTHALYATEGSEGGPGDLSSVPSPHAAPRRQRAYGGTGEQQRRSLCIRGMGPREGPWRQTARPRLLPPDEGGLNALFSLDFDRLPRPVRHGDERAPSPPRRGKRVHVCVKAPRDVAAAEAAVVSSHPSPSAPPPVGPSL